MQRDLFDKFNIGCLDCKSLKAHLKAQSRLLALFLNKQQASRQNNDQRKNKKTTISFIGRQR
jgi:hypothetical protein